MLCSATALAAPAQTFVVDMSNGPGTDFTSLAVALNAAPDGATLVVRAGTYSFPQFQVVVNKGLTILGEPGAVATCFFFTFSGLGPSQRVVVKGMQFSYGLGAVIEFQSCLGPVHVEDCRPGPALPPFAPALALSVSGCSQVSVARCVFASGGFTSSAVAQSNLACVDTEFTGSPGQTGLVITGGTTQLTRCLVRGGSGGYNPNPGHGVLMYGGDLRLLGPGTVQKGSGSVMVPALGGSGTVRATPSINFVGTTIPVSYIDEGSVSSTAAPLGGVVTARLEGSANLFGGLMLGVPRPVGVVAGVAEELWIEPFGFATSGSLSSPLTFWAAVPNDPLFVGVTFGWQGVTFGSAGAVLTNPAWFCVQ